jgi:hypothetical protein
MLQHRCIVQEFFNENPGADNFGKVKDQLSEVKDIMVENIGKHASLQPCMRLYASYRYVLPFPCDCREGSCPW